MEKLLELLNKFWDTFEATVDENGDEVENGKWFGKEAYDSELGQQLETELWDKLFIGSHFNLETRHFLVNHGYRVWIGDGDSFGILVACITKDGKTYSIG